MAIGLLFGASLSIVWLIRYVTNLFIVQKHAIHKLLWLKSGLVADLKRARQVLVVTMDKLESVVQLISIHFISWMWCDAMRCDTTWYNASMLHNWPHGILITYLFFRCHYFTLFIWFSRSLICVVVYETQWSIKSLTFLHNVDLKTKCIFHYHQVCNCCYCHCVLEGIYSTIVSITLVFISVHSYIILSCQLYT